MEIINKGKANINGKNFEDKVSNENRIIEKGKQYIQIIKVNQIFIMKIK